MTIRRSVRGFSATPGSRDVDAQALGQDPGAMPEYLRRRRATHDSLELTEEEVALLCTGPSTAKVIRELHAAGDHRLAQ